METKDEFLEIEGILIEYIPGFLLEDQENQAPESAWPSICEQAVSMSMVNRIGDYGILNKNVRLQTLLCGRMSRRGSTGRVRYRGH